MTGTDIRMMGWGILREALNVSTTVDITPELNWKV